MGTRQEGERLKLTPFLKRLGIDGVQGTFRIIVACAAVCGLFVARSVPTEFSLTSSSHAVSTLHSAHDQRPRFSNERSSWSVPIGTFVEEPPPSVHAGVSLAAAVIDLFPTKGAHH